MTTQSILPDPATQPIKIGKGPRRTRKPSICGVFQSHGALAPDDYKGTTAQPTKAFHAAAAFRLTFRTTDEARQIVKDYDLYVEDWIKRAVKTSEEQGKGCAAYERLCEEIDRRRPRRRITLPAWLWSALCRRFGEQWLCEELLGAAIWQMHYQTHIDYATQYVAEVERRTAEAKSIDDEAHAALTSILNGEAVGHARP